jgi:predicted ribosomally synthesized peptide with SipW-like signal peptide
MKTSTARFSMGIGGGLLAIAAMGTLVIGSTLALFSASETSGANAFASGTVTVGLGDTSSVVSGMAPGDSSKAAATGSKTLDSCSYNVKYTGSSTAWLAVDVAVATTGTNLYTAGANGLQFYVAAGSTKIMNGTTYKILDGTDTNVVSGSTVEHILISTTAATTDIDYLLPLLAPNALQGGNTTITLTFRAVQSANQPIGDCEAGRQCNTITWG